MRRYTMLKLSLKMSLEFVSCPELESGRKKNERLVAELITTRPPSLNWHLKFNPAAYQCRFEVSVMFRSKRTLKASDVDLIATAKILSCLLSS